MTSSPSDRSSMDDRSLSRRCRGVFAPLGCHIVQYFSFLDLELNSDLRYCKSVRSSPQSLVEYTVTRQFKWSFCIVCNRIRAIFLPAKVLTASKRLRHGRLHCQSGTSKYYTKIRRRFSKGLNLQKAERNLQKQFAQQR